MKPAIFLSSLFFFVCIHAQEKRAITDIKQPVPVTIKWTKSLKGDYSFRKKWDYPEGIFRNRYGQLSCEGFCDDRAASMLDSNGRIIRDSLKAFYQIVDTSHLYHSVQCEAWCYEWAGTDYINVQQAGPDTVFCSTELNAATHSSLQLTIYRDTCDAVIVLNSINKGISARYYCSKGQIEIDSVLWKKGILKAVFSFRFFHTNNPGKPMFWNGKMYAPIQQFSKKL